jgi:hypothetical protein
MTTASYHGVNYTVMDNDPTLVTRLQGNKWGGHIQVVSDSFTATAGDTGTTGSFIYVGKLPKGAIPMFSVISSDGAITWTGILGYSGTTDALGDLAVFSAAGSQVLGPSATQIATPLTAEKDIYITTGTQTIADGDAITTVIAYTQGH